MDNLPTSYHELVFVKGFGNLDLTLQLEFVDQMSYSHRREWKRGSSKYVQVP